MKVCLNNNLIYNYNTFGKSSNQKPCFNATKTHSNTLSYSEVANYQVCNNKINFKNRQTLPPDLYFIKMCMYPQNRLWAARMNYATVEISSMIKKNIPFNVILQHTENTINSINRKDNPISNVYGIRRSEGEHNHGIALFDGGKSRGTEYYSTYKSYITPKCVNNIYTPSSNKKYEKAITCSIFNSQCFMDVLYGTNNQYHIKSNLDLVKSAYKELKEKDTPTKKDVIETAATIQWLIAQECPYKKGSDSLANLLTRSLMHSYGIKISPLKENTSCDFEAFYRNLDDYIKIYPNLFENNLRN